MRGGGNDNDHDDHLLTPFIRFKHHVDSAFATAFNTMNDFPERPSSPGDEGRTEILDSRSLSAILMSPYSPIALRKHPHQPVPRDLPNGLDGSVFTFEDAFEDLLAVSAGQPLPDLHQRYQQKLLLRHMYPTGEPSWFWYRRLQASGLVAPKPLDDNNLHSNWERFHSTLDSKASEVWGREKLPEQLPYSAEEDENPMKRGTMENLARMRELVTEDSSKATRLLESLQNDVRRIYGPDHFDDLFSSLQNWAESGQRSWDSFVKAFQEPGFTQSRERHWESNADHWGASSQNKVEESREEHVDEHGYVHSKVTRTKLDSEGNEVSRTSSYQIYPSPDPNSGEDHKHMDDIHNRTMHHGEDKKKSGWFWK